MYMYTVIVRSFSGVCIEAINTDESSHLSQQCFQAAVSIRRQGDFVFIFF
jgi:hypothetical protein